MSQPAAEPVHLDLDLLTRAYLENLHVSLRGFQAAQEHAFLSTWVPHDNPTDSLLEILQLARDAGLARLVIRVAPETLPRLDLARITKVAELNRPVSGQMELDLSLTARPAETMAAPLTSAPALQQAASPTSVKEEAESQGVPGEHLAKGSNDPGLPIHPAYQRSLSEVLQRIRHEGTLTAQPGQVLVETGGEEGSLFALVASRGHLVVRAAHSGATRAVWKGLLECLSEALEGRPILEGADHAVITVEGRLRDPALAPVAGVVLPPRIDRVFQELEELARALLARYREVTGFAETANFYAAPVSPAWARLTDGERFRAIRQCLTAGGAEELELVTLIGQKRAVVRFRRDTEPARKQQMLAQAEARLRQTVEPTLHLVMETKQDVNILRLRGGG